MNKLCPLACRSNAFLFTLFLSLILVSCNKDEDKNGTSVVFKTSSPTTRVASVDAVTLESFKINVKEIEFEVDDDDDLEENDTFVSDVELDGPFEVDLIKNGNLWETTIAEDLVLPEAYYDEIEFEFDKNEDPLSDLFGKSILAKGTYNGKPFIFYSDEEFEVEIEFDNRVMLEEIKENVITVSVDLAALFDPALGGVSLSGAVDGNANGILEIYPGDPDGNSNLAHQIDDFLENLLDAYEDDQD